MGQQTVSRPATLDEFEVFVQSTLTTPTEPQGDWLPFAVRQDEHGDTALALIDPRYMGSQEGKELLAVELAHWMSHSPRFVVLGLSVWTAPADAGPRKEALVIVSAGRDEGMRILLARITRAPGGSPRLGAWREATTFADTMFTEAIRLAFRMAHVRATAPISDLVPLEWRGYHERRALARTLGIDPDLVQEEALIGEAA